MLSLLYDISRTVAGIVLIVTLLSGVDPKTWWIVVLVIYVIIGLLVSANGYWKRYREEREAWLGM